MIKFDNYNCFTADGLPKKFTKVQTKSTHANVKQIGVNAKPSTYENMGEKVKNASLADAMDKNEAPFPAESM